MGDWDRVHRACKDALNVEVDDMFDVSEVIEELVSDKEAISKKIIINNHTTTAYDFIQRVVCCADY